MNTRQSLLAIAGFLLVLNSLHAQPPPAMRKMGILSSAQPQDSHSWKLFYQRMREHGWIEGKHIQYAFAYAQGDFSKLPALASTLPADKVEVLVALNSPGASAAIKSTCTTPIVMVEVGDSVGTGSVKSLTRPAGNVTSVTNDTGEVSGKRLEILREALSSKLPAIAIAENEAGAGSQLSYGSAPQKQYVRGVAYVDRILRGAKPGELPIEQPTIFQFAVNLKTAKVLGITPPPSIMVRVDKVIE